MTITHSYIVACLESYAVAQEQVHWLAKILPDNWELIFMDDGSEPPIPVPMCRPTNTQWLQTHDTRPWTQDIARNKAAALARGRYLLMTDIDHVFTAEAIAECERFKGNMCRWPRRCGHFVEGTPKPVAIPANRVPPNIYLIRRGLFLDLGGYDESLCQGHYTATDKVFLNKFESKYGHIAVARSTIFVIPGSCGEFHRLARV